ncbi:endolytic transglycosylase MltG [Candidatus Saccharibacteria bacterium]|nr:endolytic transglycosylase MltG [Candidatus Saccharibacteria bacterium]
MDIKPPRRPQQIARNQSLPPVNAGSQRPPQTTYATNSAYTSPQYNSAGQQQSSANQPSDSAPQNTILPPAQTPSSSPRRPRKKRILLAVIAGVVLLIITAMTVWALNQLQPVDSTSSEKTRVTIASGTSPRQIAATLEDEGVIRNQTVFYWFTRLSGVQNSLQAGTYQLAQNESVQEIVDHLQAGKSDMMTILFYPGATLYPTDRTPDDRRTDVKTMLLRAGYTEEEIAAGLTASYSHPLLASRPNQADLEGYVYGETYSFGGGASVGDVLKYTFDEFYKQIEAEGIEDKLAQRNMTLHEGIILASIVQKEVSGYEDMRKVAQVFYSRLDIDMPLGADSTYQYIADKTGVERHTSLDSPYNTRIVKGLTPGPIASPSINALKAVANPASTDYLYFVSGDDDINYFSHTNEEHERLVAEHCIKKCAVY